MQDKDRCPECGAFNPRTNLLCNGCGARLSWADALEQERLQQRAAQREGTTSGGIEHQTVPWSDSNRGAGSSGAKVNGYAAMQRSLWRVETILLVIILLVGWTPLALQFMVKAKAGTNNVCEVCGKPGLPITYGRAEPRGAGDSSIYDTDAEEESRVRDAETLYFCPAHLRAAPTKLSTGGKFDVHDKGHLTFLIVLITTASVVMSLAKRRGVYQVTANTRWWELVRKELILASLGLLVLLLVIYSQYGDWLQTLLR